MPDGGKAKHLTRFFPIPQIILFIETISKFLICRKLREFSTDVEFFILPKSVKTLDFASLSG
jgi:hypothetical protein